jgi:hypothetical protein
MVVAPENEWVFVKRSEWGASRRAVQESRVSVDTSLFYRSKLWDRLRFASGDCVGAFVRLEVSGRDQVGDNVADMISIYFALTFFL